MFDILIFSKVSWYLRTLPKGNVHNYIFIYSFVWKPVVDFLFAIIELFSLALTFVTYIGRRQRFAKGWVILSEKKIMRKGHRPPTTVGVRKLQGLPFSCGIKISAVCSFIFSQSTRVTGRRADRQRDSYSASNARLSMRCMHQAVKMEKNTDQYTAGYPEKWRSWPLCNLTEKEHDAADTPNGDQQDSCDNWLDSGVRLDNRPPSSIVGRLCRGTHRCKPLTNMSDFYTHEWIGSASAHTVLCYSLYVSTAHAHAHAQCKREK